MIRKVQDRLDKGGQEKVEKRILTGIRKRNDKRDYIREWYEGINKNERDLVRPLSKGANKGVHNKLIKNVY